MRLSRALIALACAALMQGCVLAAAAIPLAAGGAIVSNTTFGARTAQALTEGTAGTEQAAGDTALNDPPAYTVIDTSELPAPSIPLPDDGPYGDLRRFSEAALPAAQDALPEGSYSALLADPANLQPTRALCAASSPAILIDLDPQGGLMPLDIAQLHSPSFAAVVNHLRSRNIAIAWMTDHAPAQAGQIRAVLAEIGLDSDGRDPLFVKRFPNEEKQRRRRALLQTHCVIALAGDDRSDFDDLFLYLRNSASAAALDPMLGNGWFLIPNPID